MPLPEKEGAAAQKLARRSGPITAVKLVDIDPTAWLADLLGRMVAYLLKKQRPRRSSGLL
jgi:hypothetical protein